MPKADDARLAGRDVVELGKILQPHQQPGGEKIGAVFGEQDVVCQKVCVKNPGNVQHVPVPEVKVQPRRGHDRPGQKAGNAGRWAFPQMQIEGDLVLPVGEVGDQVGPAVEDKGIDARAARQNVSPA